MTPIKAFLEEEKLLVGKADALRIRRVAPNYLIIVGLLYMKICSTPYLWCVASPDINHILRELHEGYATCDDGARLMVRKALRQGYYGLTMLKQATTFVQACDPYKKYAPLDCTTPCKVGVYVGCVPLRTMGHWLGRGPLPRSTGKQKWITVVIEIFSKWVKAKELASTTKFQVIIFLKSQVISRYGVPHVLICDNGLQLTGKNLKWFLEELCMKHQWTSQGYQ